MEEHDIREKLSVNDKLMEMPGSTFSKTWEVQSMDSDNIVVKLVDQAVGYDYATADEDELLRELSYGDLADRLKADNSKGGWILCE